MNKSHTTWRAFGVMIFITVGLLLALAFNITEWLRGGFGWRWDYAPAPFGHILVMSVIVIAYVLAMHTLSQRRLWMLFTGVIVGSAFIAYGAAYVRSGDALFTMLTRTLSAGATAPHPVGIWLDSPEVASLWRDWSALMPNLPRHVALSPPGAPMWYAALEAVFNILPTSLSEMLRAPLYPYQCHVYTFIKYTPAEWAVAWFGILMPVVAGFIVIPLFVVARQFFDEQQARHIIVAWGLVPNMALWAGSWNTLYPLFAITSFLYLHLAITHGVQHGLRHPKTMRHAYLSGLWAGVASFINFAIIPMFLLFGLYTLLIAFLGTKPVKSSRLFFAEMIGIIFGIGVLTIWFIYWLFTGETPLEILNMALRGHLDLERNYWFWIIMHVWDWVLFAGIMWALLSIYGMIQGYLTRQKHQPLPPIVILGISLWAMLIIITLSNTARGETGRVWSWMTPFLLLSAYDGMSRLISQPSQRRLSATTAWNVVNGMQALSVVILAGFLAVFNTELTPPPLRPEPIADVIDTHTVFTRSTDHASFILTGWRGEYDPQRNALILWLNWTSDRHIYDALWFAATPVSPDGVAGDMVLWQPRQFFSQDQRYPTTCWSPNQPPLGDMVIIPLPDDPQSGGWWVSLAIFGDAEGVEGRLSVDGELQVGIGGIRVDRKIQIDG